MANAIGYGFRNLKDVFNRLVTEVGVEVIDEAQTQTFAEHQRQMDAVLPLFATPTTEFKTVFHAAVRTRNQVLTEAGRARPIKGGSQYEVGFPIIDSGNAWGFDWKTGQKMTVEDANNATMAIVDGDMDWTFDHMLAGIYSRSGWTFKDKKHGDLNIVGLANGDSTVYGATAGSVVGSTDDHYLYNANAISDSYDPYPEIFEELDEHPENGVGDVIAFIPSGLKATTMALGLFRDLPDSNITPGNASDVLSGTLGVRVPGKVLGYHASGVWIVEWKRLVANYIVAVHTGGNTALRMRQEPEPNLQGLIEISPSPARTDYPNYERQWVRYAGFGGWNRVGALVYRIGTGSWADPTNYTAPIS